MPGPVLLNNVDHQDIRVRTGHGADYGDAINQITVFPTEYEELQREYSIVLRRDGEGEYRSVALLGLDPGENLYLDGEHWQARYIPALIERGPFSIGLPSGGEAGEPMVHIDLDHPRVSRNEGQRVFRDQGGNAPYLDHVAGVLRTIYAGIEAGPAIFAAFETLGLIEPVTIEIALRDSKTYKVPDCHTIQHTALMQLDGAGLEQLHRQDFLRPAIWLASSLGNVRRLADAKTRRDAR